MSRTQWGLVWGAGRRHIPVRRAACAQRAAAGAWGSAHQIYAASALPIHTGPPCTGQSDILTIVGTRQWRPPHALAIIGGVVSAPLADRIQLMRDPGSGVE